MLKNKVQVVTAALTLSLIALIAVLWFALLTPRLSEAEELNMRNSDLELTNLGLMKRQRDFLDLAQKAPLAAADAQILFSKMPETAQLPDLLNQITNAAVASGIDPNDIQVINASIPVSTADTLNAEDAESQKALGVQLATLTLDLTVDGSRRNLLQFMDNLQQLDRSLLITSTNLVDIPSNNSVPQQTLTISGTLFVLESRLPDLVTNAQLIIDRAQAEAASGRSPGS